MSDCQTCEREGVCDYAHKPCDCVHYRKFVAAPKRPCDDCIGSGWNAYPIRCRACNGCGFVRDDTPHNTRLDDTAAAIDAARAAKAGDQHG